MELATLANSASVTGGPENLSLSNLNQNYIGFVKGWLYTNHACLSSRRSRLLHQLTSSKTVGGWIS